MTTAEYISAAALVVSAVSAFYAYRAPIRAEKLKAQTAQRERELNIFSALMSERGRWGSATMLTALNAAKVIFRDNQEILDAWFVCYSRAGSDRGSPDQYLDLVAAVGRHLGFPMRREDLENFFVNPIDQKESAIRNAQIHQAFAQLSTNTVHAVTDATPRS
ncbi:DUF6680 family protein [Bradyrhizobium sp. ORS 86]|uniref:DUF6680 family protein n=1 Tax=Bradyrhizobium sp. ORS 86 TaxID=1685970 RepID=UPI00388D9B62